MTQPTGLSGHTRLAIVIGDPVRHSLSPAIHNAGFAACGLDWVFLACEVPEGRVPDALRGAVALGIEGLSVTMPHKAAVAEAVDELSPTARLLGAVNCVARHGDRLVGHSTDGGGFVDALGYDVSQCGFHRIDGATEASQFGDRIRVVPIADEPLHVFEARAISTVLEEQGQRAGGHVTYDDLRVGYL